MGWKTRLVIIFVAVIEFETLLAFLSISSKILLPEIGAKSSSKSNIKLYDTKKDEKKDDNLINEKPDKYYFLTEKVSDEIPDTEKVSEEIPETDIIEEKRKEDGFFTKSFWKRNFSKIKDRIIPDDGGRKKKVAKIKKERKERDRPLKSIGNKIDEIRNQIEPKRKDESETKIKQKGKKNSQQVSEKSKKGKDQNNSPLTSMENKIDEIRSNMESKRKEEEEAKELQLKAREIALKDREKKRQKALEERRKTMEEQTKAAKKQKEIEEQEEAKSRQLKAREKALEEREKKRQKAIEERRKTLEGKTKTIKEKEVNNEKKIDLFQTIASIPDSKDGKKKDLATEGSRSTGKNANENDNNQNPLQSIPLVSKLVNSANETVVDEPKNVNDSKNPLQSIPIISKLVRSSNETVKDNRKKDEKSKSTLQSIPLISKLVRSGNETAKGERNKDNDNKNPLQSIPIISKFVRPGNETSKDSKEKSGFNPVLGTQRFVSNVWESTIGSRDQWIAVLPKSRIDPGEVIPVNIAGLDLLVIASRDGDKLYCIANSCAHLGTPLETGIFERRKTDRPTKSTDGCEDCIVCPLHQTAFSVETGEVNGPWCPYPPVIGNIMGVVKQKSPLATFDIRTRGKNIEIKINSRVTFEDSSDTKN